MDGYDDIAAAAAARVKQRQADWEARVEQGRAKIRAGYEQTRFLREEEGHRMRVILEKASNMVSAFFAELDRVRREIPDELLNDWLFWQVGRTLNSLDQLAKIFDFDEEDRIRVSLKKARILAKEQAAAERAQAAAEKAAERAAEGEARRQREAEKAEKVAEAERRAALATARLERGRSKVLPELVAEIKARLISGEPIRRQELAHKFYGTAEDPSGWQSQKVLQFAIEQAKGEVRAEARLAGVLPEPPKRRRRNDSRDVVAEMASDCEVRLGPQTTVTPVTPNTEHPEGPLGLDALASAILTALSRVTLVRSEWIELTLKLATYLRQARERSGTNAAFSAWLAENGITPKLTKDSRAALLGMGRDLTATRTALENSDSWSWEINWKKINHLRNAPNMVNADAPAQTLH